MLYANLSFTRDFVEEKEEEKLISLQCDRKRGERKVEHFLLLCHVSEIFCFSLPTQYGEELEQNWFPEGK